MPDLELGDLFGGGGGDTNDYGMALFGAGGQPLSVLTAGGKYGPSELWDRNKPEGGGGSEASDALAALYGAEYDDYLRRFVPIENEIIKRVTDPSFTTGAVTGSVEDVRSGYANADQQFTDRMGRLGLTLTPQQQAARDRTQQHQLGLSEVEVANRVRQQVTDRNLALIGGGAFSRGDALETANRARQP